MQGKDPIFDLTFAFPVSKLLLADMVVEISLWHHDKFGRDVFLGRVDQALSDLGDGIIDDWYPLKQKKPTDKVSGEVHFAV
jgi:synaptotagmin-like protein